MDLGKLAQKMDTKKIEVKEVIFKMEGKKLIFNNPKVVQADMMGKKMYQVIGKAREVDEELKEDDIKIVMEKTGCSKSQAAKSLKNSSGPAEAIMKIREKE